MARNYSAEYAARNARAQAAGFGSYWEQRQLRAKAEQAIKDSDTKLYAPGSKSREAVALRDSMALAQKSVNKAAATGKKPDSELIERIRKQCKGDARKFYPLMRALYGKKKGK